MTSFVERQIAQAGLAEVLPLRARGEYGAIADLLAAHAQRGPVDLLILGALADAARSAECGVVVRVHPARSGDVRWIDRDGKSELDLLRAIAIARITGPLAARLGVDWGTQGFEVPQVALGFGITDLTGPMTRKSGDLIDADDLKKVKGQGMVAVTALRRKEIAALVHNAGRECHFTDDAAPSAHPTASVMERAHASRPAFGASATTEVKSHV